MSAEGTSDLLYRIQSRLGDDAAVLWDNVVGGLNWDREDLAWNPPVSQLRINLRRNDDELWTIHAWDRKVALWCPHTKQWVLRVGFNGQYEPFEDNGAAWERRVRRLDMAIAPTKDD